MNKQETHSAHINIRRLIVKAELLYQGGNLLKAASILKRADNLIRSSLKSTPQNDLLLIIKTEYEKCWNKIIDAMARSTL